MSIELASQIHAIQEVLIVMGAVLVSPKEIYTIRFSGPSAISGIHTPAQLSDMARTVLRALVTRGPSVLLTELSMRK